MLNYLYKIIKRFKAPLKLALIFILIFTFGDYCPLIIKQFFLAVSLTIKQLLYFVLPFIIFSFLFNSLVSMKNGVFKFVIMLFTLVYSSNFIAILTAYIPSYAILPYLEINSISNNEINSLAPLWDFALPKFIANETALMAGLFTGILFSIRSYNKITNVAQKFNQIVNKFLKSFFIPILPLFIAGFVFKMQHEGVLGSLFKIYGPVIILAVSTQIVFLSLYYLIAANFKIGHCIRYIKNVFPAGFTGFTTMSSAAAMPISIMAAEKNIGDRKMAEAIIPTTVNIHTIGSAIGLTTMAVASLLTYKITPPDFLTYLKFTSYYAIAKFAVAGIPGGAVFVATPLFETFFGFNDEMSGLLTALYMFFDPFSTSANVMGNGAFAIVFNKLLKRSNRK